MEAEARTTLSEAVAAEPDESEPNLAEAIRGALRRSAASISTYPHRSLSTRRPRFDP